MYIRCSVDQKYIRSEEVCLLALFMCNHKELSITFHMMTHVTINSTLRAILVKCRTFQKLVENIRT